MFLPPPTFSTSAGVPSGPDDISHVKKRCSRVENVGTETEVSF